MHLRPPHALVRDRGASRLGRGRPWPGLRPRTRGQAVVEFALILPVFLLVLLIAVDVGRLFFTWIEVGNAAREGAAYAAGSPTDTAGITTHAAQETNAQAQRGQNAITVSATCADQSGAGLACTDAPGGGGTGNTITVSVSEPFTFFTPLINGFFNNNLHVGSSATAAVINLAAGAGGTPGSCTIAPNASFTVSVTNLTVTLDATASTPNSGLCAISGYNWDMGDGLDPFPPITGEGGAASPLTYTYASAGTYTITLLVTNSAQGTNTSQTSRTITVGIVPTPTPGPTPTPVPTPTPTPVPTPTPTPVPTPTPTPAPVCNFIPSFNYSESGKSGHVNFYGSYTGQPTPMTWSWDYGDGGTYSSSNPDPPRYDYSSSGTYNVTLTITNNTNGPCSQHVTQQVIVQ